MAGFLGLIHTASGSLKRHGEKTLGAKAAGLGASVLSPAAGSMIRRRGASSSTCVRPRALVTVEVLQLPSAPRNSMAWHRGVSAAPHRAPACTGQANRRISVQFVAAKLPDMELAASVRVNVPRPDDCYWGAAVFRNRDPARCQRRPLAIPPEYDSWQRVSAGSSARDS